MKSFSYSNHLKEFLTGNHQADRVLSLPSFRPHFDLPAAFRPDRGRFFPFVEANRLSPGEIRQRANHSGDFRTERPVTNAIIDELQSPKTLPPRES